MIKYQAEVSTRKITFKIISTVSYTMVGYPPLFIHVTYHTYIFIYIKLICIFPNSPVLTYTYMS